MFRNSLLFISLLFLATQVKSQCDLGEVEVEIVVHTDDYGYEGYWELTANGDFCGVNTIFAGGNEAVGCVGAGAQDQTPGGYGNNLMYTEGPWCLTEGEQFDITYRDDWGDGGFMFDVIVNGFNVITFEGIGLGGIYTFTALQPEAYDLSTTSADIYSYVELGLVPIGADFFNAGTETVQSFDFNYDVNGGEVVTQNVNFVMLENFESAHIDHETDLQILELGVYTIRIWADNINGEFEDGYNQNDTLVKVIEAGPGIPNIIDSYIGAGFELDEIVGSANQVDRPTDLDFHPVLSNKEMWITNKGIESIGGSTVTVFNVGESDQSSIWKRDGNAWHFMSLPTGIAFSQNGNWANSPGVYDANHNGGDAFTGPALWSSDMSVYAEESGGNGSHLDMLHASPECQGIAAEVDNVFWVFDGYTSDIVRYDFQDDHGPGNSYHGDAIIRRYSDDGVAKDPQDQIVSHLVLDKELQWLYVVDHGNARVIRIDINTGSNQGGVPNYSNPEAVAEYSEYTGYTQELVIDGLNKPAGIDIIEDRMILTDYESGEISIYDISSIPAQLLHVIPTGLSSLQGVKIGPDGRIYFVDYDTNAAYAVDITNVSVAERSSDFNVYPNPSNGLVNIHSFDESRINSVKAYDVLGNLVYDSAENTSRVQLDLTKLNAGVYQLIINSNRGVISEKLILN